MKYSRKVYGKIGGKYVPIFLNNTRAIEADEVEKMIKLLRDSRHVINIAIEQYDLDSEKADRVKAEIETILKKF